MIVTYMQNVIDYFINKDSAVCIASTDASKAFDRINHNILVWRNESIKLVKHEAPRYFIGTLISWYSKLLPVLDGMVF